jgi:hypothetical protein
MFFTFSSTLHRYLLACLLIASTGANAGSAFAVQGGSTSAQVDIRVVIPEVLRVLEDSHPAMLPAQDGRSSGDEASSALQRVVMLSTLRKGFCLNLRIDEQKVAQWKLQLSGSANARMEATADGYRLCVMHAGRYELALSHHFVMGVQHVRQSPVNWPVYLSLAAP